jgi:DeoR/GlpR family transcriptional regulator of sugar metabolism
MLSRKRKQHLLALLQRNGQLVAKELSAQLEVSEDTIRRDLRELASDGLLQRVHGGALPSSPAVADFAGRQRLAPEEKVAIGRAAAQLVQAGQVFFVDGGTTAVQLARSLKPELVATCVTHSPSVAVELVSHPGVEVILIGGRLFKHSVVAVGAAAVQSIERIHADLYFMGVTGVHPKAGLSTGDMEEAEIKRAMVEAAAETVVMASSEKLGVASPYVIAKASAMSTIVVAPAVPGATLAPYRRLGVRVVRAEG